MMTAAMMKSLIMADTLQPTHKPNYETETRAGGEDELQRFRSAWRRELDARRKALEAVKRLRLKTMMARSGVRKAAPLSDPIAHLPVDVVWAVCDFLSASDIARVALCSRAWAALARDYLRHPSRGLYMSSWRCFDSAESRLVGRSVRFLHIHQCRVSRFNDFGDLPNSLEQLVIRMPLEHRNGHRLFHHLPRRLPNLIRLDVQVAVASPPILWSAQAIERLRLFPRLRRVRFVYRLPGQSECLPPHEWVWTP
jgi:hypothetical protein